MLKTGLYVSYPQFTSDSFMYMQQPWLLYLQFREVTLYTASVKNSKSPEPSVPELAGGLGPEGEAPHPHGPAGATALSPALLAGLLTGTATAAIWSHNRF